MTDLIRETTPTKLSFVYRPPNPLAQLCDKVQEKDARNNQESFSRAIKSDAST